MTTMMEEVRQQPDVVARLADRAEDLVEGLASGLAPAHVSSVVVVARGSSDNAARYAQYLLGWRNRLPVSLAAPSLITVYETEPRFDGAIVVAISQSGQSPDVVAVLEAANRQGRPTVAITNDPASPLARVAGHVLDLGAGVEHAVAATKTYTASLVALALLSASLTEPSDRSAALEPVRRLPDAVGRAVEGAVAAFHESDVLDRFPEAKRCLVVGRGLNYSTAFEIALKVKELSGLTAEPYSPADLLHGPIAAVGPDTPAVLVAPSEPSQASVVEIVPELADRGADPIVITDSEDLLTQATSGVPVVAAPAPWLTPITTIIPGQVMSHEVARLRGLDPDDPSGLQKVTRTR